MLQNTPSLGIVKDFANTKILFDEKNLLHLGPNFIACYDIKVTNNGVNKEKNLNTPKILLAMLKYYCFDIWKNRIHIQNKSWCVE